MFTLFSMRLQRTLLITLFSSLSGSTTPSSRLLASQSSTRRIKKFYSSSSRSTSSHQDSHPNYSSQRPSTEGKYPTRRKPLSLKTRESFSTTTHSFSLPILLPLKLLTSRPITSCKQQASDVCEWRTRVYFSLLLASARLQRMRRQASSVQQE